MKNRLLTTFAVAALALGSTAVLRAEDPSGAADAPSSSKAELKASDDARQLMKQISDAYADLKSLDAAGTIAVDIQIEGASGQKHSSDFTTSFVTPNKFRHEVKGDLLVGSTGQKLYTYKSDDSAYTMADAPKEKVASKELPRDLIGVLEMQDPSLVLALSKAPSDELAENVTEAAKDADTTIGEASYPTLALSLKDHGKLRLSVDPQTHLVRQARFDLTAPLKQRRADLASAIVTVDYTRVSTESPAKDELFAWAPPPGAKDATAMAAAQAPDAVATSELEGKKAPEFKLDQFKGKPVSLADLKGKVVILDFWATWCGPCRMGLPHLDKVYKDKKGDGLKAFAVNLREEKGEVEQFVKQTGLSVPILMDTEGKVAEQYGVEGIPQTVVIGKDGKIRKIFVGYSDQLEDEVRSLIDKAMKE